MRSSVGYVLRCSVLVLSAVGVLLIGSGYAETSHTTEVFTNASLQGTFAVTSIGVGGQTPEAGVAVLQFNGQGAVQGVNVQNLPGDSSTERTLVKSSVTGTYQVEEDGTGSGRITSQLVDGSTIERNFDFVLANAHVTRNFEADRRVFFMARELSEPTNNLITSTATKLPEEGKFSLASFKGTFAFRGFGPGNQDPAAGFGQITFDGKGKFTGFDILNVATGPSAEDRMFIESPFEATYEVDEHGIFTAFLASGAKAVFIMTKAHIKGHRKVAQEYFYMVPSESTISTGGFFIISLGSKLSD
jgi:hypothetical protein